MLRVPLLLSSHQLPKFIYRIVFSIDFGATLPSLSLLTLTILHRLRRQYSRWVAWDLGVVGLWWRTADWITGCRLYCHLVQPFGHFMWPGRKKKIFVRDLYKDSCNFPYYFDNSAGENFHPLSLDEPEPITASPPIQAGALHCEDKRGERRNPQREAPVDCGNIFLFFRCNFTFVQPCSNFLN